MPAACDHKRRVFMAQEPQIRDALLAALILTGSIEVAELAVSDAIAEVDFSFPGNQLLFETAKCALHLCNDALRQPPSILPPELQSLFLLTAMRRHSFVMRVLMGFSMESCSAILNVHEDQVAEALYYALTEIPQLAILRAPGPVLLSDAEQFAPPDLLSCGNRRIVGPTQEREYNDRDDD